MLVRVYLVIYKQKRHLCYSVTSHDHSKLLDSCDYLRSNINLDMSYYILNYFFLFLRVQIHMCVDYNEIQVNCLYYRRDFERGPETCLSTSKLINLPK